MHAVNRTKSRGTIFYAGGPMKIGPGGPHKMGDQIFYDSFLGSWSQVSVPV